MGKNRGSKYHPSRTSGMYKQRTARDFDENNKKRKKEPIKPLDLSRGDWSLK